MLVKDIYGGNYEAFNLDGNLLASTLGKTTRSRFDLNDDNREQYLTKFKQEDLIKSILMMICYNLAQLSTLYASLNNIKKVLFGGYFINNNELIMKILVHGIKYWSSVINFFFSDLKKKKLNEPIFFVQNQIECYFLRHEGYLGAVGAFIKTNDQTDCSWYENMAHSSPYKPSLYRATKCANSAQNNSSVESLNVINECYHSFKIFK